MHIYGINDFWLCMWPAWLGSTYDCTSFTEILMKYRHKCRIIYTYNTAIGNIWFKNAMYISQVVSHYDNVIWASWSLKSRMYRSAVCSTSCSGLEHSKHQSSAVLALCEGNPATSDGFCSQWASNVGSVSLPWHHNVKPIYNGLLGKRRPESGCTWNINIQTSSFLSWVHQCILRHFINFVMFAKQRTSKKFIYNDLEPCFPINNYKR